MANGHELPEQVTHQELAEAVKKVLQKLVKENRRPYVTAYQIFTLFDQDLRSRLLFEGAVGGVGHGEVRAATQRIAHAAVNMKEVEIEFLETCHLKFFDIPNAPPNQIEIFPSGDDCGLYRLKA